MSSTIGNESGIPPKKRIALYAIGGNALSDPQNPNSSDSSEVLKLVIDDVMSLLESGLGVVLTHGNGPQVGDLLMLEEKSFALDEVSRTRSGLDSWVAATQGMIGNELANELDSKLKLRGRPETTAVIMTRVEVDMDDLAFQKPTKPVGPVLDENSIEGEDWDIAMTGVGPRRVVASPKPVSILDIDVISNLCRLGAVVICGGGGGIPVSWEDERWTGSEAVIDKDLLSAKLAIDLDADIFVLSTAVDSIMNDFGGENQSRIDIINFSDANEGLQNGDFPAGSMGPKIEAMLFSKGLNNDMQVVLCSPGNESEAIRGECGTKIVPH